MSWPQNPNDPAGAQPQQPPQPPQGFGPPPAWPPADHAARQPPPPPQSPPYPTPPYGGGPAPQPGPYGGYPQPGPPVPPAPPSGGRRTALIVGCVLVALALIGGGVFLATRSDGSHPKQADARHSPTATSPAQPTPTDQGPDLTDGGGKPMVAGWQTQSQQVHDFRYDVPPTSQKWKLNASDVQIEYTGKDDKPVVAMSGTAEYREGGCSSDGPSSGAVQAGKGQLATVGTQGSSGGTLQTNARNVAGNWVWAAYGGPTNKNIHVTVSKAVRWKHNGIDGYMAKGTATHIVRPSACVPPRGVSYGISQRLPDGTISEWVIYADQDVPHALTTAQITKIMDTVRPYGGS